MKVLAGFLLGSSLLVLGFCTPNQTEKKVYKDLSGEVIEAEFLKGTSLKHGLFIKRDKSGNEVEIANYQMDTPEGIRILFDDKRDTLVVETYKKGLFEGPFRTFYSGNRINVMGNYRDNKLQGEVIRFYESGRIMEKVNFSDNEENGFFEEYYENGKIKAKGHYKNGPYEEGELSLFDEKGEKTRTMLCQEGKCKTTWSRAETF